MACCGPSIKRVDEKTLFEQLQEEGDKISLNLNKIEMIFQPNQGEWKCNYY